MQVLQQHYYITSTLFINQFLFFNTFSSFFFLFFHLSTRLLSLKPLTLVNQDIFLENESTCHCWSINKLVLNLLSGRCQCENVLRQIMLNMIIRQLIAVFLSESHGH